VALPFVYTQGFFVYPFLQYYSPGCALLQERPTCGSRAERV